MTLPLRVNADYELELFTGRRGPEIMNESLEFLAFYLEERPIFTRKKYSVEFLEYVEKLTGFKPVLVSEGPYVNWWGQLQDLELERTLNSKIFSSHFSGAQIVTKKEELNLQENRTYLAKDPFGMSGQNIIHFKKGEERLLDTFFSQHKTVIIEPLLDRVFDFSHYVFPDGNSICYQNLVDKKFQYKGTIFHDITSATLESLPFYSHVPLSEWNHFRTVFQEIVSCYRRAGATNGYSLDSFVYEEDGKKIRSMSEVNYRKTMGLVSWRLLKKFSTPEKKWGAFLLGKKSKNQIFRSMQERVSCLEDVTLLSPGDGRFEMFLLQGRNQSEGKELFKKLKELLPDAQFSVEI